MLPEAKPLTLGLQRLPAMRQQLADTAGRLRLRSRVLMSNSIFQTSFDASPTSELLLSPSADPIILAANAALLRTTGRRREDVVGKRLFDVFPERTDDHLATGVESIRRSLARVIASGETDSLPLQRYPIEVPMPDGSTRYEERYWTPSSSPVYGTNGELLCISHRTVDVTDKKRMEDVARQSASRKLFRLELIERLRALSTPEEILGAAAESLGRSLEVVRVLFAKLDEDRRTFVVLGEWNAPEVGSTAGMERRWNEVGAELIREWCAGTATVVTDATLDARTSEWASVRMNSGMRSMLGIPLVRAGNLTSILVAQHTTPRNWAEIDAELATEALDLTWSEAQSARSHRELRAERDLIQSILESMAEGFALFAPDWTVIQVNALGATIAQRTQSDLLGRNHWEVFPEAIGSDLEAMYCRVQATGRPEHLEHLHTPPGGEQRWIEIRAYRIPNGHLAVFFHDVTRRKETEDALRQANARKDEFLAMLAHELRNPLAPISSAASLMQMKKLDEAGVRRTSEIIGRQVRHMTSLVDDLLDVSRVTRGLIQLDKTQLDAADLIAEAVEQITPVVRQRRHELVVHTPPTSALVMGDRKRLVQVISNLLNNSAKYTPEGGQIGIRTEVRSAHVLIEVTDNGIGIAPDLLPQIFELFTQGKRTPDRASGGLGLGLALVKSLVELHSGTVSSRSGGVGEGSVFTVYLPRVDLPHEHPNSHDEIASLLPAKSLKIMVVDDNEDAAAMLSMFLEASGHEVVVEHSSSRALVRAGEIGPQVYMLDIGLPDMDGYELARQIRRQSQNAGTVLIAVTGYGQEADREQSRAAGFDHHLVKPVQMDELGAILKQLA